MITRVRGHGQIELRSFALTDMIPYGYSGLRVATASITEQEVRGIPAINRAARLRAEAVAALQLYCWQGDGVDRVRVDNNWQTRLFQTAPNDRQTQFTFWETVEESLSYRGNAYVWKMVDPMTSRITDWWALHPDQVTCKAPGEYEIQVGKGFLDPTGRGAGTYELGDDAIIHFRGHGQGGMLEAPSPMRLFRDTASAAALRKRHELRMWTKGAALQQVITAPQGMKREDAMQWRDAWRSTYSGTDGETTAVLGGGLDLKPIGMTLTDSQYVEMTRLTVADAALMMAVPANLLGVQTEKAVPNLEQDITSWYRFGLGPELSRIEKTLADDPNLFPSQGRSIYPAFDTEGFVTGDVLTEAQVLVQLVQSGILLPDEARRIRGLDKLPNGMGQIPQITPVGGAPNPVPPVPPPKSAAPALNGN